LSVGVSDSSAGGPLRTSRAEYGLEGERLLASLGVPEIVVAGPDFASVDSLAVLASDLNPRGR
jgi:hypothetical protein